ncbi:hypothetical protein BESB_067070 [Besnoitia besnoiti]|uniref:Transmembrane protein n=1 Tax=Besnoitia besnoiti TaxID=94643 RepID=A0A2A9MBS3_BESBE|nr:hypothetical protein BESB_067070 [Besnoitia besnoiti]PFH34674.1 hypothetical protein BESB_067070 [Besnoitia besnoiti]
MEKYRVFSDESTGVHPFIPVAYMKAQLSPPSSLAVRVCSLSVSLVAFVCKTILVGARLLLLFFSAFLAALTQQFLLIFLPFPYMHWLLSLWLMALPARLALFALGVWNVDEQAADFRRLKIRAPPPNAPSPWSAFLSLPAAPVVSFRPVGVSSSDAKKIRSCRVCLASFTGLVEPLYLAYRLAPRFALVHEHGGFSFCSIWDFLKFSLQFRLAPGQGTYRTLSALLLAHEKSSTACMPVVIFPEGQKSNGTCILQWTAAAGVAGGDGRNDTAGFDAAALQLLDGRVAEVGCIYTAIAGAGTGKEPRAAVPYGPPHTVHPPMHHLRLLLSTARHGVAFVWAAPSAVQASVQQQLQSLGGAGASASASQILSSLREVMTRMLPGLTAVKSKGGKDLCKFNEYWEKTQQEQYLKNNR